MYISVDKIPVKKNQDFVAFDTQINSPYLIICDGIGEYNDSGLVAQLVVEKFSELESRSHQEIQLFVSKIASVVKEKEIIGGTTFISAQIAAIPNMINISYLGNGGIMRLPGDFAKNPRSEFPYRYADILLPDVSPEGTLKKHISYNSGVSELMISTTDINLVSNTGDILVFFSDGISSLEEKIILRDNENRFWRNEASTINIIFSELDKFLCNSKSAGFQDSLVKFNNEILNSLYTRGALEDDASLGFIITENVLDFYKNTLN